MSDEARAAKVDLSARIGSGGRVTIPQAMRDALGIEDGDELLFRVEEQRAILSRISNLLALAGSVSVPASKRGKPWDDVLRESRRARAAQRR
jgi:AbrB family looped-hinge helix DNA binding protein